MKTSEKQASKWSFTRIIGFESLFMT